MNLDNRIPALIAVGASILANCQPCLERHVGTASRCGANIQQIAEVIEMEKRGRQDAVKEMEEFGFGANNSAGSSWRYLLTGPWGLRFDSSRFQSW
jgi:AhpD family alkylhydroperoxidase